MSRTTASRSARKSALGVAALLAAISGLAGCSSGDGGCPEGYLDVLTKQGTEGTTYRQVPADEFPVEELRSPLANACIVVGNPAEAGHPDFYLAVPPLGVSAETLVGAATGAGFYWTGDTGAEPFGLYARDANPAKGVTYDYFFLKEVDSAFREETGTSFVDGQVSLYYQELAK